MYLLLSSFCISEFLFHWEPIECYYLVYWNYRIILYCLHAKWSIDFWPICSRMSRSLCVFHWPEDCLVVPPWIHIYMGTNEAFGDLRWYYCKNILIDRAIAWNCSLLSFFLACFGICDQVLLLVSINSFWYGEDILGYRMQSALIFFPPFASIQGKERGIFIFP